MRLLIWISTRVKSLASGQHKLISAKSSRPYTKRRFNGPRIRSLVGRRNRSGASVEKLKMQFLVYHQTIEFLEKAHLAGLAEIENIVQVSRLLVVYIRFLTQQNMSEVFLIGEVRINISKRARHTSSN
jgi:hypothetical protein